MAKPPQKQSRPNPAEQPSGGADSPTPRLAVHAPARLRWVSDPALCTLLFLLVIGAFLPSLRNDFISFDDPTYVTENTHVQSGLTWQTVRWAMRASDGSNWHPLTWLSHSLDCQLFGLKPWGHHLTNLLLHAANALLLFLVFKRMTGATWPSFFVAALFGVHPLHVESVAWVAERKDVLSTFFFLATLWAYSRYVECRVQRSQAEHPTSNIEHPTSRITHHVSRITHHVSFFYLLALLCFALGLLCKPMLVTLPFVLLLLDYWPLNRLQLNTQNSRLKALFPLLLEKLPFLTLALASSAITLLVQQRAGATAMLGHLPLLARVENAVVACCRYLGKLFWPVNLSVFYPHPGSWPVLTALLAGLVLLGVSAFVLRRHAPYLVTGWFWFLGTLVPVLGLVQVGRQSMADRYTYIPLIGIFMILAWSAHALTKHWRAQTLVLSTAAVLLSCAALTWRQIGHWKDSETLFRHALEVTENNYLAHSNLGVALQRQGRMDEALREYQVVLKLQPDDVNTRNGLASLLLRLGRVDEAISQFQETVRHKPDFAEAHNNLAYAFRGQGRLDEAAAEYREALKLNPADFRIRLNFASILLAQGHSSEAVSQLEEALKSNPADAATRNDLGSLLFNSGRVDEALRQFEEAVRLDPASAEAQFNLGAALTAKGRREEAIAHLTQALKLRPNYPEAQQQLQALTQKD